MRFNQHLIALLSLLFVFIGCAYADTNIEEEGSDLLSVTPKVCIVEQAGDSCEVKLNVQWQSLIPLSRCLYQNKEENLCWLKKTKVSQSLIFDINQSQVFSLLDEKNKVLAFQQVKLNTHEPKKYRRRLRADWSLF